MELPSILGLVFVGLAGFLIVAVAIWAAFAKLPTPVNSTVAEPSNETAAAVDPLPTGPPDEKVPGTAEAPVPVTDSFVVLLAALSTQQTAHRHGMARVLSLFFPGAGQIYLGNWFGIGWLLLIGFGIGLYLSDPMDGWLGIVLWIAGYLGNLVHIGLVTTYES